MSALKQAILHLDQKVGDLEISLESLEGSLTGKQRDMFAARPASNGNGQVPGGVLIAKRLDSAIEKVERLLKEGKEG